MATTEAKAINALLRNKDIHTVLLEDSAIFGPYGDILDSIKSYYSMYRTVPDISVVQDEFSDFEVVDADGETKYYVDTLKNEFIEGRIQQIMLKGADALETSPPTKVLEKLQTELAKLGRFASGAYDVDITDHEAAMEHFKKVRERSAQTGSPGIPTGFKIIDAAYPTGLAPGHLVTLLGYTGRSKTFFSELLAVKAFEQGYKPMIVSLEMSPSEQRERIYPMMDSGRFRISDMSRGLVDADDFRTFANSKLAAKQGFVIVSNSGHAEITPNVIQAKIDTHRPDLVIVDYAQICQDNARSPQMTQRMMNLSRELKMMAVQNDIPIILITAVTDEQGDKRDAPPMLSQISWSSAIEYNSNLAISVHKHDDVDLVEIVGVKNRHGQNFNFMFNVDLDRGIWNESTDF